MTIAIRSGLERLVSGVRTYLTSHTVDAAVDVGRRALAEQLNQGGGRANRIVFVPFDPSSGAAGRLVPPQNTGPQDIYGLAPVPSDPPVRVATVRAIGDWERTMLVSVWATDRAKKNEEFAQAIALEHLIEWTKRAVDSVGLADVEWTDVRITPPEERHFGLEARLGLRFTHPIFDVPIEVGPVGFSIEKGD